MLGLAYLTRRFMHNRNCYVVTDRRALVVGYIKREVYTPADLKDRTVSVRPNGVGNIVMGYDETAVFHDKRGGGSRKETRREPIGFIDVADVEDVEQFLRQKLRLSSPKSYDHVK
jgi:hypothetical protein